MISFRQIHKKYNTQDACMELLVSLRWPEGVRCVRCNSDKVYKLKHRAWNWQCKQCSKHGYRFSALVGTVFENTNYPLPVWFEVIYLICQSKKGMSALQIQQILKENGRPTAYKTAFYICDRVRAMPDNPEFPGLMGEVEIDETYRGGKKWSYAQARRRQAHQTSSAIV